MALNLQVEQVLSVTAQPVKDQNGNTSPLTLATDAVVITAGGKTILVVNTNGLIGIGTLSPQRTLHIVNGGICIEPETLPPDLFGWQVAPGGSGENSFLGFHEDTLPNHNGIWRMVINKGGNVGIGTTQVGNPLEVVGNIVSRESSSDNRTAVALAAESDGLGSLWTNRTYNPSASGSGWQRTVNMINGNVGIGQNIQNPQERLEVEGNILATGDIRLAGADCAEEFDLDEGQPLEPGTVMVISDEERLRPCMAAYDTKVAGVLSGAGDCRPGIILGKHASPYKRIPLALTGKVYCKVDAHYAPIGLGDLLTTSPTRGHAMKATDPLQAFGAVLGKALRPLTEGQGLIPILVALQ
jgi:hypothetical protein